MTTETTNVTPIDTKKSKVRIPFIKKNAENRNSLHGVYVAGALLLVVGGAVAVASKLKKSDDAEDSSDNADA